MTATAGGARLPILRQGSAGAAVVRWQHFLIGRGHLAGRADGQFGPVTSNATKAFQRSNGLSADGVVGPATTGTALLLGFDLGFTDPQGDVIGLEFPTLPEFGPPNAAARRAMFGSFPFEATGEGDQIRILDDWAERNIVTVTIPQLIGVPVFNNPNSPSSGRMRFHNRAVPQLLAMWQAWEDEGLLSSVLSYEGSFNPRFVRGGASLSNHAFGSAFDVNASWNGLGAIPALAGSKGSLRELVPIANRFGFFWGGHFKRRPDGMHFEVARIVEV